MGYIAIRSFTSQRSGRYVPMGKKISWFSYIFYTKQDKRNFVPEDFYTLPEEHYRDQKILDQVKKGGETYSPIIDNYPTIDRHRHDPWDHHPHEGFHGSSAGRGHMYLVEEDDIDDTPILDMTPGMDYSGPAMEMVEGLLPPDPTDGDGVPIYQSDPIPVDSDGPTYEEPVSDSTDYSPPSNNDYDSGSSDSSWDSGSSDSDSSSDSSSSD